MFEPPYKKRRSWTWLIVLIIAVSAAMWVWAVLNGWPE